MSFVGKMKLRTHSNGRIAWVLASQFFVVVVDVASVR